MTRMRIRQVFLHFNVPKSFRTRTFIQHSGADVFPTNLTETLSDAIYRSHSGRRRALHPNPPVPGRAKRLSGGAAGRTGIGGIVNKPVISRFAESRPLVPPSIVTIQSALLLSSQTILIWLLECFRELERSFRQWIERPFPRSRRSKP